MAKQDFVVVTHLGRDIKISRTPREQESLLVSIMDSLRPQRDRKRWSGISFGLPARKRTEVMRRQNHMEYLLSGESPDA